MSGKWFFLITVAILLLVFGMLTYPTVRTIVGNTDTTGFVPLLAAAVTLLPYGFLGFAVYAVWRLVKR